MPSTMHLLRTSIFSTSMHTSFAAKGLMSNRSDRLLKVLGMLLFYDVSFRLLLFSRSYFLRKDVGANLGLRLTRGENRILASLFGTSLDLYV